MNAQALAASAALAAELSSPVDPRSIPVRFSRLKHFARSPLHYWQSCQFVDDDDSLPLRLGTGTHLLLFGHGSEVVTYPGRRAGAAWEAFQADHTDKVILSSSEFAQARRIADAVLSDGLANAFLFEPGTIHERQISWERNGRQCRSTPDVYHAPSPRIVDLKTTKDASPDWFAREAIRRGYHAQLVFYAEAIEATGGAPVEEQDLYIVAVESKPPHPVVTWQLTQGAIDAGRRLITTWWEQLRVCEESGVWPGYTQAIQHLDVDGEMPVLLFDEGAPA